MTVIKKIEQKKIKTSVGVLPFHSLRKIPLSSKSVETNRNVLLVRNRVAVYCVH